MVAYYLERKAHDIRLKEYARELSKKSPHYNSDADFDKYWNDYNVGNNNLTIASFYDYSKKSNPIKFKEICSKYL